MQRQIKRGADTLHFQIKAREELDKADEELDEDLLLERLFRTVAKLADDTESTNE